MPKRFRTARYRHTKRNYKKWRKDHPPKRNHHTKRNNSKKSKKRRRRKSRSNISRKAGMMSGRAFDTVRGGPTPAQMEERRRLSVMTKDHVTVGDLEKREREYRLGIVEEVARKKATGEPSSEENLHSIGMCTQKHLPLDGSRVPSFQVLGKVVPITARNCPFVSRRTPPSYTAHLVAQAARRRAEYREATARIAYPHLQQGVTSATEKWRPRCVEQEIRGKAELEEAKEALKDAKKEEEQARKEVDEEEKQVGEEEEAKEKARFLANEAHPLYDEV
jgi:hypothetical protein